MAELLTADPRLRTEAEDALGSFQSDPQGSSGWGEGAPGSEDVGPRTDAPQGLSSPSLAFPEIALFSAFRDTGWPHLPWSLGLIDHWDHWLQLRFY